MANVNVDTIAAYSGKLAAQGTCLGPEISSRLALFFIHQMNRLNFHSGYAIMTAP